MQRRIDPRPIAHLRLLVADASEENMPDLTKASTALFCAVTAVTLSLIAVTAQANPGKVAQIIERSGRSGVVRGPNTISKAQKAQLQTVATALSSRLNARVYFVLLPSSADNLRYANLYDQLGMDGADLLAASNGRGLALRCNALAKADKDKAWKAFRDAPKGPMTKFSALVAALPTTLAAAPRPRPSKQPPVRAPAKAPIAASEQPSDDSEESGTTFAVILLIIGVATVIWRRSNRDAKILREFKAALDPLESDLADMYLSMDGLEQVQGFDGLLEKATTLSGAVDGIKAETPNRQAISKLKTLGRDASWLKDEMSKLQRAQVLSAVDDEETPPSDNAAG